MLRGSGVSSCGPDPAAGCLLTARRRVLSQGLSAGLAALRLRQGEGSAPPSTGLLPSLPSTHSCWRHCH